MSTHLPFNALRTFEAAARNQSFKLAAEELFVTPAAVSQQIKFLEDYLGVELFHRFNRKIELTEAGKLGLAKLTIGFETLADAVSVMRSTQNNPALTIWSSPSFAAKWLMPRLAHFRAAHQKVDLNISAVQGLIDNRAKGNIIPAENFHRYNIDVAIRFGSGHYPGCRVDKLFNVSAVPLCSPALLQGEKPLKTIDDLRHHTLLHDDTPYEGRPSWTDWLLSAGVTNIDATHGISFNSVSLALSAAIAGQGVVLTLDALAEDDLAAGRLVMPFKLSLPLSSAYYLISLEETAAKPNIREFREWLLQAVHEAHT